MSEKTEIYGDRKKREFSQSRKGMKEILKEARNRVVVIDQAARDRNQMTERWTDDQGRPQRRVGHFGSIDPDHLRAPDLVVNSTHRSIQAINRACGRALSTIRDLTELLATNYKAMPLDLEKYMDRLVAGIPSLDTIVLEVVHPKPAPKAKP